MIIPGLKRQFYGSPLKLFRRACLAVSLISLLILIFPCVPVSAADWSSPVEQPVLTAADAQFGDLFGSTIAISGDTLLVGAIGVNSQAGAAYVYIRDGSSWTQQSKLEIATGSAFDLFGSSVALDDDIAIIGANGENGETGAAYIYTRSNGIWSQQARLTALDGAAGDWFGYSVAISGDTAVVGAANYSTSSAGAVYVYTRSGSTWVQRAKLTAPDAELSGNFGCAVSIDDGTLITGAYLADSGAGKAYIFTGSGAAWLHKATLTGGATNYGMGISVALKGNRAVVGAYDPDSTVISGAAFVFKRDYLGVWSQQAELVPSDSAIDDRFGISVAMSGLDIAVGAPGQDSYDGAVYIFSLRDSQWVQQAKLSGLPISMFGTNLCLNGASLLLGVPSADGYYGAVYEYTGIDDETSVAAVGGEVYRINPGIAIAPWLVLGLAVAAVMLLVLNRKKTH